jgi:hypothetical protein
LHRRVGAACGRRDSPFTRQIVCRARHPRTPKNPRFWPAKKSPLPPAKNPLFCTFRGEKWAFLTNLCTKMHIFDTLFADIAPGLGAVCPSGKNPPIYTVLNAAFSAPGPPRLWHRGGTPVPDALTRAPVRPNRIFDKIEKSI